MAAPLVWKYLKVYIISLLYALMESPLDSEVMPFNTDLLQHAGLPLFPYKNSVK
jgi:hypothetical protein